MNASRREPVPYPSGPPLSLITLASVYRASGLANACRYLRNIAADSSRIGQSRTLERIRDEYIATMSVSLQACYHARRPALRVTNHLGHSSTEERRHALSFAVVVTVTGTALLVGATPTLATRAHNREGAIPRARATPPHLRQHHAQPQRSRALCPRPRRMAVGFGAPARIRGMDVPCGRRSPATVRNQPPCRRPSSWSMMSSNYLITQNPCASTPSGTLNLLRKFSSATAAVSSTSCGSVK